MNLKNKYLVNTLRILFGAFMIFSGVSGFLMGPSPEGIPEQMIGPTHMLWDTGIFQMIKTTETVAGLMLLINFLPALAVIFIAPIVVGVIIVNARLTPSFLPLGIVVSLFTAYFGYVYWDKYKALFKRK